MTQRQQAGSGMRALVLIAFHHAADESVERLRGQDFVVWADAVKGQVRGLQEEAPRPFTGVAEIRAESRTALDSALDYIEKNFSHVEAYEF